MTQVSEGPVRTRAQIKERTLRTDPWFNRGRVVATLLSIWVIYATVRVFTGHWYFADGYNYLTPFYSPCVSGECAAGSPTIGTWIPAIPPIIPYAFVSLPFVLGFRLSCYYYRGAYYRAFWRAPAACAVREPHATYTGETRLPLISWNWHRIFLYFAVLIAILLTWDLVNAFWPNGGVTPDGTHLTHGFGFGLGTIIMLINVVAVWAYTLTCHSCRHIMGGRLKHFSKHPVRYWIWTLISKGNEHHMAFAWISLATLMVADFYIMLVAANAFPDPRFFN
ncbi:MAG: hypothetical protein ACRDNW_04320 [Trebonia sp.]